MFWLVVLIKKAAAARAAHAAFMGSRLKEQTLDLLLRR